MSAATDRTPVPLHADSGGPIVANRMLRSTRPPVVRARSRAGLAPGLGVSARPTFATLCAWGVAMVLVLAMVVPASAAAGPTRLSGASVSPGSGTTGTTIAFAATYRNREGSPADWVRVTVAGSTHAMSTSGSSWKAGVRFTWSGKLPAGTHAVTFEA